MVTRKPTLGDVKMVPGLFSWAKVILYGRRLGATPNGRRAGEPVSHGPNPYPGFNEGRGGAPDELGGVGGATPFRGGNQKDVVGCKSDRVAHAHPDAGFMEGTTGGGPAACPAQTERPSGPGALGCASCKNRRGS